MTTNPSSEHAWPQLLNALISRQDLRADQTRWAMNTIMAGEASDAQMAGFLVALRAKGETVQELTGLVEAMLENAKPIDIPGETLDIVGTGGDRHNTVNISSMAALVCAGAGAKVVKHGNRASSSASGSADVIEALGVRLDLTVDRVAEAALTAGITFCFAQVFHPSMRYAAVPRREMGVPTAFNFMGPLTNPARPAASAIGVADARLAPLIAGVLAERGVRALVFRGEDGLDEMTTTGVSTVWEVRDGAVETSTVDPWTWGYPGPPWRICGAETPPPTPPWSGVSWPGIGDPCVTPSSSMPQPPWWRWIRMPRAASPSAWPRVSPVPRPRSTAAAPGPPLTSGWK